MKKQYLVQHLKSGACFVITAKNESEVTKTYPLNIYAINALTEKGKA